MAKRIAEYIGTSLKGRGEAAQKQLRTLVERYPYYQAARLLWLCALHETRDQAFSRELSRAAVYVPSRSVLYQLIEADRLRNDLKVTPTAVKAHTTDTEEPRRTTPRRTVADASTDYVSYMLQVEADTARTDDTMPASATFGQQSIDDFLQGGGFHIADHPDEELQKPDLDDASVENGEVLTETLARIYIKQGKYDSALEIIQRLSLKYPKKNRYFADQIRFLGKLIVNNNNK